jgi:hypothetical protein
MDSAQRESPPVEPGAPPNRFGGLLANLWQVLQMVGLVVGGAWGFWTWQQISAPALRVGLAVGLEASAAWNPLNLACRGQIKINVENEGIRSIAIANATYRLASVVPPRLGASEKIKMLGTYELVDSDSGKVTPELLLGPYEPKEKRYQILFFLFAPDPTKQFYAEVVLQDESGKPIAASTFLESCKKP